MKTLEVHTTLIEERVVEVAGAGHGIAGSVYIIYCISVVDKKEGTWIRKVYLCFSI
jgi:hypothetical protein